MRRKQDPKHPKDTIMINIQDFIKNEEEEIEQLEFQILSKKISIPFHQFTKYVKISNNLALNKTALIGHYSSELEKLVQNFDVKEKSISLFFDFLQEKNVSVGCDEFIDFCRINKIFKVIVFSKYLRQFWQNHSEDVYFQLIILIESEKRQNSQIISDYEHDRLEELFNNNELIFSIENNLENEIEECLSNDKFGELQISTIYRIIEQSQIKIKNNDELDNFNDLLFEFINKSLDERFLLFSFLKVRKLSESNFQSLCNNYLNSNEEYKTRYDEMLPFDLIHIKEMKETQKYLESQIKSFQNKNKQFEDQNSEITKSNQQFKSKIESLEETKKQLENQQVQLNNSVKEYEKQIQMNMKQKEEDLAKIKELIEKNDQLSKEIFDLKESSIVFRIINDPKIFEKRIKIIRMFCERMNNEEKGHLDQFKQNMFFLGCETGNFEVVKCLILEEGSKININSRCI